MSSCDDVKADLIPYAEQGDLPKERKDEIRAHLETCPACTGTVEHYRQIMANAKRIREGEEVLGRIEKRVDIWVLRALNPLGRILFVALLVGLAIWQDVPVGLSIAVGLVVLWLWGSLSNRFEEVDIAIRALTRRVEKLQEYKETASDGLD